MNNKLVELTERVKSLCNRGVSSPIELSQVHLEIENEILDLKLAIAKQVKLRALQYYRRFRGARWEGDVTKSYNEASAEAKADTAPHDENISSLKAYRDYFENLSSILKSYNNSYFRD